MSVDRRSGHAIVLGASIGGLLAARALSESFEKVTVFDRDDLPAGATNRRGVPQGEHLHGLLARGRQILEEFFPGFTGDLTAQGAVPVDVQRDCIWRNDGRAIPRASSGIRGICLSRPALEAYVRDRVQAIAHVEIRAGHEALGLLTDATGDAVSGARVLARNDVRLPPGHDTGPVPGHDTGPPPGHDTGPPPGHDVRDQGGVEQRHDAELVVDATGRGNRGPTWLAEIGFERPPEERVDPQTTYVSRDYRRSPGDADFAATVTSPSPANPHGGIAIATEGDRWMVTLFSAGGAEPPPTDPDGYLEFTARLPARELRDLLHRAEPLGPPRPIRLPTSVRRRYEHLRRLPEGFIAVGDSVCTFNPAYAQGMTVAAAQANVLRDLLLHKGRGGLTRQYFAGAAKVNDVAWDIAVGADLRYPAVVGPRSRKTNFLNAYVGRLHVAAERHPVVGRRFLSVANLMTPPTALFAPGILARVLWSGR
ncbi:hypothetical protein I0C86_25635 [Plantactinospora sp. S1510]|uniref:FAD-binding monooxygenase n=1 Tax=Plantactinospora alkalitolerans TaxID=2789879 RepID=A0ABS0H1G4_9ACTN|nr:NAD(P)-binding protein [Plantactinospora alkalitolerans]MBF9132303.1 hypothetical protein [Plantactinospora alkalitolerans]